jgi:hypothetical protein
MTKEIPLSGDKNYIDFEGAYEQAAAKRSKKPIILAILSILVILAIAISVLFYFKVFTSITSQGSVSSDLVDEWNSVNSEMIVNGRLTVSRGDQVALRSNLGISEIYLDRGALRIDPSSRLNSFQSLNLQSVTIVNGGENVYRN